MSAISVEALTRLLAGLHPALVHAPIAATLFLPLALMLALHSETHAASWLRTARFLAILGLLGAVMAVASGFLWARDLGGIAAGDWFPHPARPGQVFPNLLRDHQRLALLGLPLGVATLALIGLGREAGFRRKSAALACALLWALTWGAAGHWGGRMVFPDPPASAMLQRGTAEEPVPLALQARMT